MKIELATLLALCAGAKDPQMCHKYYENCHSAKVDAEQSRRKNCEDQNDEKFKECLRASGGMVKESPELLHECVAEYPVQK